MGITQFASNPMLFEKSLKLFAALSTFPNFGLILGDDSKAQRYVFIIRDIFAAGVSSTVVQVVAEQIEKVITKCPYSTCVAIFEKTLSHLVTKESLVNGDKVTLGLLNFGIARNSRITDLLLDAIRTHHYQLSDETTHAM